MPHDTAPDIELRAAVTRRLTNCNRNIAAVYELPVIMGQFL